MTTDPLPRLRTLCLALPETTERLSHGEPTWFVRDKKTTEIDWAEIVTDAYRVIAPKGLVALLATPGT